MSDFLKEKRSDILSYIDQFCFMFILCNFNGKWHILGENIKFAL